MHATQPNVISDATLDEPCVLTFSGLMTFTLRDVVDAFGDAAIHEHDDPALAAADILEAHFGSDPRRILEAMVAPSQWKHYSQRDYCDVEFLTLEGYLALECASKVYAC